MITHQEEQVIIRDAVQTDAADLAAMAAKSFRQSHHTSAAEEDIDDYISNAYNVQNFVLEIADIRNHFRIAEVNGHIAGYSKIIPDSPTVLIADENICKMERLYVLEEFLDLKIGKLLFDDCLNKARQLKQNGIWLNVWTGNHRAIRFYEKQGFVKAGDTVFRISERHSNPNYLMWKAIHVVSGRTT